ncbi:MAG: response regulator [Ginsengibacter sp.]
MKKILVVDDEDDILNALKIILTRKMFSVETTANWKTIPQTIQTYKPDLILLDVSLSGADGRDICNELKGSKETMAIPVVLISAHYNLINNLKGCKPDAIITKPFDSSNLLNVITGNLN